MGNGYYIYKHFDKMDNLIYVGVTGNIARRVDEHLELSKGHTCAAHKRSICRVDVATVPNKTHSEFYETYLINKYKPKYNKAKNASKEYIMVELPELDWTTFRLEADE